MRRLVVVLVCLAVPLFGCSDGFTQADWDKLHDWCLEHQVKEPYDCGRTVNQIESRVNNHGADEECIVRAIKRAWVASYDYERNPHINSANDC